MMAEPQDKEQFVCLSCGIPWDEGINDFENHPITCTNRRYGWYWVTKKQPPVQEGMPPQSKVINQFLSMVLEPMQ